MPVPVVAVPVVPVPPEGVVVDGVDVVVPAATVPVDELLFDLGLLRTMMRTRTTTITTTVPTSRKITPPRRELGRSVGRGIRRLDSRSRSGRRGGRASGFVPVGAAGFEEASSALARARAVPSGISGSGLLATGLSSEASTRAHARSYGDSARRSRVCSATLAGSWPSR